MLSIDLFINVPQMKTQRNPDERGISLRTINGRAVLSHGSFNDFQLAAVKNALAKITQEVANTLFLAHLNNVNEKKGTPIPQEKLNRISTVFQQFKLSSYTPSDAEVNEQINFLDEQEKSFYATILNGLSMAFVPSGENSEQIAMALKSYNLEGLLKMLSETQQASKEKIDEEVFKNFFLVKKAALEISKTYAHMAYSCYPGDFGNESWSVEKIKDLSKATFVNLSLI